MSCPLMLLTDTELDTELPSPPPLRTATTFTDMSWPLATPSASLILVPLALSSRGLSSTLATARGPLSLGYGHGYGYSHGFYGYGKRSADAYYGAATSAYAVNQAHPGYAGSYQQVSRLHSGIGYGYGGYLY